MVCLDGAAFGQGFDSTRYTKSSQYSNVYQSATVNVYVAFDGSVPANIYHILGNGGTNMPATTGTYYVPGCYGISKTQPLGVSEVVPVTTTFLAGQGGYPIQNPYYTAKSYVASGVHGHPEWRAEGGETVDGIEWRDSDVPASYTPGDTLPPNVINITINVSANSPEPPTPGGTKPTDPQTGGDTEEQKDENEPPDDPDCGMLHYSVHSLLASLHLTDTPLSYVPAFGPALNFTVNYNHREVQPVAPDTASTVGFSNLGPQWTFNWLSYVTDDPSDPAQAQVYVRGGGTETYTGYNAGTQTYARDLQSQTLLIRTTANSYEKQFPDGHRYLFTQADGSTVSPRRIFLSKVIDPQGNEMNLGYNEFNRLETLTDATGKVTTLQYEQAPTWYYRITKVVDPFGRSAKFQYYPDGRLRKITDAIDLTSEVTYEVGGNFINTLTTPYGLTQFTHGENGTQRWVEITDPRNTKERIEYRDSAPGTFNSDTAPAGFFNAELHLRNTFHWDKKAFAVAAGDYTKAHVTHWLKSADGTTVTSIVENEKPALESRIWYAYEGQTAGNLAGLSDQPTKIARRLMDGTTQLSQFTYNALGHTLSRIDPVGRSTTFSYQANGIDLLEVRNTTLDGATQHNDLLASYSNYLNHQPQTITDAAGKETQLAYNGRGQVETVTNAKGEVTKFVYHEVPAAPEFGRVLTVTRAFGTALAATTTYAYDAYGRAASITDSENYAVALAYDAAGGDPLKSLDRGTRVTFPDTTYQETRYDDVRWPLDVAHTRDRLGRETAYEYNELRNPVKVTDPQGRMVQYVPCPCGAMDKIIDPRNNETEWTRDLQKRITAKKIAGVTVATYTYEPDTGRLATLTDGTGTTSYGYHPIDVGNRGK
jgi:YD repeat-containing protein